MSAGAVRGPAARPTLFDRWLFVAFVAFGLQALSWVALGSFDPFGVWDGALARAFYDGAVPPEVARFRAFVLGPFGATTAGYFALAAAVVHGPFRRREPWAWNAVAGSLALWFVVDTAASLAHGAAFNVWIVNVPCAVAVAIPLVALRREFGAQAPGPGVAAMTALMLVLAATPGARAEPAAVEPGATAHDPAVHDSALHDAAKLRTLVAASGAGALGDQLLAILEQQVLESLRAADGRVPDGAPAIVRQALGEALGARKDELDARIAEVYARAFSPAEIDELVAFYTSPVGSKLTAQLPAVMAASMREGRGWVEAHRGEIDERLRRALSDAGIALPAR